MKKMLLLLASAAFSAKALDNRLEVTFSEIKSNRLPTEFDNFKIAHISDLHNGSVKGLVSTIKAHAPDIIAFTGDMTSDKRNTSFLPALNLIKELTSVAPCFLVSGNHDTWRNDYNEFVFACKNAGAYFLQNETQKIHKNGKHILISGMEDVFTKVRSKQKTAENLKYFSVSDEYRILLFHRANALDVVKDFGFDLILSGHLHGGQIRIPFVGGMFPPLSGLTESEKILFPEYTSGVYRSGKTTMIVNRGLGNPIIIPRIFNRPELGIITLKSSADSAQ